MKIKSIFSLKKWILFLLEQDFSKKISDKSYIKLRYYSKFGKSPNLENPETFNEKLQWLKLYNRSPLYTTMVDKLASKQYVTDKIGAQYVIPALGGPWYQFDEIDFDSLPNQFVLKTNHDSGGVIVCRDKSTLDKAKAEAFLSKHLQQNYYWHGREWPYKDVKPCIFAEQYMEDPRYDNKNLNVYKIFCFGGTPKIFQVIQNDKTPEETIDYFDTSWTRLNLRQNFPNSQTPLARPDQLEQMIEIATTLSQDSPFIRVDLYQINDKIYFSEFTFFSDSGFAKFTPGEWDTILGTWIHLPKNIQQTETTTQT